MRANQKRGYFKTFSRAFPWFLILFVVLYFEDRIFLGGVSLSNIWKIALYLLIFLFLAQHRLLAIRRWQLYFSAYLAYYPFGIQSGMSKLVFDNFAFSLPILAGYFVIRSIESHTRVSGFYILHSLSVFLIITSIPFLVGVFEIPDTVTFDQFRITEKFNSNLKMFVGFFKHPNLAGKAVCFSTALALFSFFSKDHKVPLPKWTQVLILALGIIVLYSTFVRASWIAFALIVLFGVYRLEHSFKFIVFLLAIFLVSLYIIDYTLIYNRLLGMHNANTGLNMSNISSGRTDIWTRIISYQFEQGLPSVIFGLGGAGYLSAFGNIYAHNMLVQAFAHSGMLGLGFLFLTITSLMSDLRPSSHDFEFTKFARSLVLAFLFFAITSHGLDFWSGFIFGGVIVISTRRKRRVKNEAKHFDN